MNDLSLRRWSLVLVIIDRETHRSANHGRFLNPGIWEDASMGWLSSLRGGWSVQNLLVSHNAYTTSFFIMSASYHYRTLILKLDWIWSKLISLLWVHQVGTFRVTWFILILMRVGLRGNLTTLPSPPGFGTLLKLSHHSLHVGHGDRYNLLLLILNDLKVWTRTSLLYKRVSFGVKLEIADQRWLLAWKRSKNGDLVAVLNLLGVIDDLLEALLFSDLLIDLDWNLFFHSGCAGKRIKEVRFTVLVAISVFLIGIRLLRLFLRPIGIRVWASLRNLVIQWPPPSFRLRAAVWVRIGIPATIDGARVLGGPFLASLNWVLWFFIVLTGTSSFSFLLDPRVLSFDGKCRTR